MMEEMEILSHEQHKLQGGEKRFQLQTGPDFTKCDVIGNYIDFMSFTLVYIHNL